MPWSICRLQFLYHWEQLSIQVLHQIHGEYLCKLASARVILSASWPVRVVSDTRKYDCCLRQLRHTKLHWIDVVDRELWTFAVIGLIVWNSLSNDLRDPELSIASFGHLLKIYLVSAVRGASSALEALCNNALLCKFTLTVHCLCEC